MKGGSMIKSSNKSKKTQTVKVQQQSGQITAPHTIQDIPQSKPSGVVTPSHEEIAMRAYEIYIQLGRPQGQSEQIWQQAEQDIQNKTRAASLSR
jgi:hypothetical protein